MENKTIWYNSKYVFPKHLGRLGARGVSILREMVRGSHHCIMFCSVSNHFANSPAFDTPTLHLVVDGVEAKWIATRRYESDNSLTRILSWLDFEWRLWRMPRAALARPDLVIVSSLSLISMLNGLWLRWRYLCQLVFEVRDI